MINVIISFAMIKNSKYILLNHFHGEPKEDDFSLEEEVLPPLQDEEILCQAMWFSVDPYMRVYTSQYPPGITMIGLQVAKVIASKHNSYEVGDHVVGFFGWQTHSITNISKPPPPGHLKPYKIPYYNDVPLSLALGILGRPGISAYFGFLEICQPKKGEVVAVSGAAGAVGSHVGQIARILGCKVIGFSGSDEKVRKLLDNVGFHHAFNYKDTDINEALREAAPEGIDCYFDNVGGEISSTIINHMNNFGRIAVCGSISSYNAEHPSTFEATVVQPSLVHKQLKMEGFHVSRWLDRFIEGITQNYEWIKSGKLKYFETITDGFENLPKAFINMMRGQNFGKAVVKA